MRSAPDQPRRAGATPFGDYVLFGEALIALTAASLAIRLLPFRVVVAAAVHPAVRRPLAPERRRERRARVRRAVTRLAGRLPWRPLCFPQGLAAQWMLRRRGIPSVLYYGAAPDRAKGVAAHVWVCDDDVAVVGGEAARGMAILARFPGEQALS